MTKVSHDEGFENTLDSDLYFSSVLLQGAQNLIDLTWREIFIIVFTQ